MKNLRCRYGTLIFFTVFVIMLCFNVNILLSRNMCNTTAVGATDQQDAPFEIKAELRMVFQKHILRNLKEELRHLEWNKSLDDLVMQRGGSPLRILLVGHWRSGSSFMGQLLASHPGTFYIFEPFLFLLDQQIRGKTLIKRANYILESFFHCRFNGSHEYLTDSYLQSMVLFQPLSRLSNCNAIPEVCFDVEFLSKTCRSHPVQVIKTVRYRLDAVAELLGKESLSNLKVVYVIRDPRAIMKSRLKRAWCRPGPECESASLLCEDLAREFRLAQELQKQFPDRFVVQSYESMVKDYVGATKELFGFRDLEFTPLTSKLLQSEESKIINAPFLSSHFAAAGHSKHKAKASTNGTAVKVIEESCASAMELWGYASSI